MRRAIDDASTSAAATAAVAEAAAHSEDLDVVSHVEHHPAREQHGEQWQHDREQREAGQLQAHAGE